MYPPPYAPVRSDVNHLPTFSEVRTLWKAPLTHDAWVNIAKCRTSGTDMGKNNTSDDDDRINLHSSVCLPAALLHSLRMCIMHCHLSLYSYWQIKGFFSGGLITNSPTDVCKRIRVHSCHQLLTESWRRLWALDQLMIHYLFMNVHNV